MRRGQIFLVSAFAAVIIVLMFISVAMQIGELTTIRTENRKLIDNGLLAIQAIIKSGAIEKLIEDRDDIPIRNLMETLLPSNTYYSLTLTCDSNKIEIYNKPNFEPKVTIKYIYTSVDLKTIFTITLRLSIGG